MEISGSAVLIVGALALTLYAAHLLVHGVVVAGHAIVHAATIAGHFFKHLI